ncbi:MAG: translation initiation factor IF-2 [Gammaproteobacteria bacterium]|nr:translation initiation factor IF-2 [Gammaproteobacteria bacterium]
MSQMTAQELAKQIGTGIEQLLEQFKQAGLEITTPEGSVSEEDKERLLSYLRHSSGHVESSLSANKLTLKKKTLSQLKIANKHSVGRIVEVEVRKKRSFVKPTSEESESKAKATQDTSPETPSGSGASSLREGIFDRQKLSSIEEEIRKQDGTTEKGEETPQEDRAEPIAPGALEKAPESRVVGEEEKASKTKAKKKPKARVRRKEVGSDVPLDPQVYLLGEPEEEGVQEVEEGGEAKKIGHRELRLKPRRSDKRVKKTSGESAPDLITTFTKHKFEKPTVLAVKEVAIQEGITAGELAQKMSLKAGEVIAALMNSGMRVTINQPLDQATASIIVEELGHTPVLTAVLDEKALFASLKKEGGQVLPRPPVVTVMGHVDHGKTSLLDRIRETQVASGESGGITQHIGAYRVHTPSLDITFLDTPGHAAFTAMRARGSQCTDIVVLVVAADDGVMPQTVEAILHAKAANVPVIVAINKIDKPDIDLERIKTQLAENGLVPEEWGGDALFVHVSAKTGQGIQDLLNAILLQSELLALKAPIEGLAQGVVIEASLDRGRGPIATVLVRSGTLRKGDILLVGSQIGRVRLLLDENGQPCDVATPSIPVRVVGCPSVPRAGDQVVAVEDERKAKEISEYQRRKHRENLHLVRSLEKTDAFVHLEKSGLKRISIVLKADVQGSVEALSEALEKLSNEEVNVSVIYKSVGGITDSDVHLAKASSAGIIGFNVRAEQTAKRLAGEEGVSLSYYSIIYDALDDIKKAVHQMVAPVFKEVILGVLLVKEIFRASKLGTVAGCLVQEGTVRRDKLIRVLRNQVVIHEGTLSSLRRHKEDVSNVAAGTECGIGIKNYSDIQAGDRIEVYEKVEG